MFFSLSFSIKYGYNLNHKSVAIDHLLSYLLLFSTGGLAIKCSIWLQDLDNKSLRLTFKDSLHQVLKDPSIVS